MSWIIRLFRSSWRARPISCQQRFMGSLNGAIRTVFYIGHMVSSLISNGFILLPNWFFLRLLVLNPSGSIWMDNPARHYRFGRLWAYGAIQNSPGIAAWTSDRGAICLYAEPSCDLRVWSSSKNSWSFRLFIFWNSSWSSRFTVPLNLAERLRQDRMGWKGS